MVPPQCRQTLAAARTTPAQVSQRFEVLAEIAAASSLALLIGFEIAQVMPIMGDRMTDRKKAVAPLLPLELAIIADEIANKIQTMIIPAMVSSLSPENTPPNHLRGKFYSATLWPMLLLGRTYLDVLSCAKLAESVRAHDRSVLATHIQANRFPIDMLYYFDRGRVSSVLLSVPTCHVPEIQLEEIVAYISDHYGIPRWGADPRYTWPNASLDITAGLWESDGVISAYGAILFRPSGRSSNASTAN